MHVSDWLPTLYSAAGGNITDLGQIDGISMWDMLQTDGPQVRTEILHNIDPRSKFSAIRVGDYKLVQGDISDGRNDGWYPCSPGKQFENNMEAGDQTLYFKPNAKSVDTWPPSSPYVIDCGVKPPNYTETCFPTKAPCLYHILTDPCEYVNIADSNQGIVKNLLNRIDGYSKTAVEPVNQPIDKLANPAFHNGVWVPWEGSD